MILRRPPRPPHMPRLLRKVEERLRHIHQPPAPLKLEEIRAELEKRLPASAPAEAATVALDAYVDSYLSDWLRDRRAHHSGVLNELDLLAIQVQQVLEFYLTLHEDINVKLADLEGAVSHALERVSDPDIPYFEPVPRKRHGGNRP